MSGRAYRVCLYPRWDAVFRANGGGAVMPVHRSHGEPHPMTPRVDELPAGVPADARVETPQDRDRGGRFQPGNTLAKAGGIARKGKSRLAARLSLKRLADDAEFRPYKASASAFRKAQCAELAKLVGGGVCGPGPSSIVASAALALAWSRYFSDAAAATGDAELASKAMRFAESSRNHLLSAHELCAWEAKSRDTRGSAATGMATPWLVASSTEETKR